MSIILEISNELIDLILRPGFRLDLLLPNFHILQKVHSEQEGSCKVYDTIISTLKKVWAFVIHSYMVSVKKDRVPIKNKIIHLVEKFIIDHLKIWKKDQYLNRVHDYLTKEFLAESTILLYALTTLPTEYVKYLQHNFFNDLERINTFDDEFNINWLMSPISQVMRSSLKQMVGTVEGLLFDWLIDELSDEVDKLLHFMNKVIVEFYVDCKGYIQQSIVDFKTNTVDCQIINKFVIIGLFQEVSHRAFEIVDNYLQYTIFQCSDVVTRESFARFVLSTYESLQLIAIDEDIESNIKNKYSKIENQLCFMDINDFKNIKVILSQIIGQQTKIKLNKVMSKIDGRYGILVSAEQPIKKLSFLMHRPSGCNRLIVTNAHHVPHRWTFIKAQEYDTNMQNVQQDDYDSLEHVFQSMHFHTKESQFTNQKKGCSDIDDDLEMSEYRTIQDFNLNQNLMMHFEAPQILMMQSAAGDIGSSLGYCLANINRYNSKKEFLQDFGTTAAINGSLTYIVCNMPIIGNLIAVGGFGYFAARIYRNDSASTQSKNRQFEKLLVGTSAGVGSSVGGAIVGQVLIPIPMLGAIIGGFIGGLVGGTSTAVLFEYMNESKAKEVVEKLEQLQGLKGNWNYDEETIALLGLSNQYFSHECPHFLRFDDQKELKWLNLICYAFICVFYTQKEQIKIQKNDQQEKHYHNEHVHSAKELHLLDEDKIDVTDEEWPQSIDLAILWLLQNNVQVQLALTSLNDVCKNIISNL